ncbi:MFS transporter [Caldovatus sediminis]|uniref:MFS transporter n=1 Tax=Caldovatus sediminis TaxID=2041189 RepID=A0A8J3EB64_9PROT|nr:tripartite tricarboxylate transporter substrate-binding protein [Caldovatus sediminis]GGG23589.1 MFS transporter [Caldovatus sediminis]
MLRRRPLLLAAAAGPLARPARGQERYPSRPVRLIIPVGVGGVTDVVGRIYAEHMQGTLGRPVVVENIPGAGSRVGAAAFHRAPADGYTIMIGTNNHPVMRAIDPNFPLDPVTDFLPFALVGRQPFVLAVHPDVPAQDVASLLAWLREKGEAANFGAANPGATNHLAGELFRKLSGATYTFIPYRTAANAVQDLVAGRMQLTIDSPTMLAPLMRDGRVRGLAVSSAVPSDLVPGLPSIQGAGIGGYEVTAWQVLFARPGTPPEIVARLEEAAGRAAADPELRRRLANASVETWPDPSAAAAAAHVRAEVERWVPLVTAMNLRPN